MLKKLLFISILMIGLLTGPVVLAVPDFELSPPENLVYTILDAESGPMLQVCFSFTEQVETLRFYDAAKNTIVQFDWSYDGESWQYTRDWDYNWQYAFGGPPGAGPPYGMLLPLSYVWPDGESLFFRCRVGIEYYDDGFQYSFGSWTEGVDLLALQPFSLPLTLPEPLIAGEVELLDSYFATRLLADDSMMAINCLLKAADAYNPTVEAQLSLDGKTWQERLVQEKDGKYFFELSTDLPTENINIFIRWRFANRHADHDISGEWSTVQRFIIDNNAEVEVPEMIEKQGEPQNGICSICQHCSRFLGLCVFQWLAICLGIPILVMSCLELKRNKDAILHWVHKKKTKKIISRSGSTSKHDDDKPADL